MFLYYKGEVGSLHSQPVYMCVYVCVFMCASMHAHTHVHIRAFAIVCLCVLVGGEGRRKKVPSDKENMQMYGTSYLVGS